MNYLVIGIIIYFLCMIVRGYQRGLFRAILSFGCLVAALLVTYYITPYVVTQISNQTDIDQKVKDFIVEKMTQQDEKKTPEADVSGQQENNKAKNASSKMTRKQQKEELENSGLPAFIQKVLADNNNKEFYHAIGADTFTEYVAGYFSGIVVNILCCLLTWAAAWIVFKVVSQILGFLAELPILSGLNHIGGAIVGLAQAGLMLCLFFLIVTLISSTQSGKVLVKMIETNAILLQLYQNNPIMKLVTDITHQIF